MEEKKRESQFHVSIARELIGCLIPAMPKNFKAGQKPQLETYVVTPSDSMMPTVLKIRDRKKPVPGEVYRLFFNHEKRTEFVDGLTGKQCQSRDRLVLRLYVQDPPARHTDGELRFYTASLGAIPVIFPAPVVIHRLVGVRETGILWIAAPGVEYQVSVEQPSDQVLFNGPAFVQVSGTEETQWGAVKISGGKVDVYDRRSARLTSYGRAEHIRRTIGRRTFEFVNVRDITEDELRDEPPEHVLTNDGLVSVEDYQ